MAFDFDSLAADLLRQAPSLLQDWFPLGKMNKESFEVGNIDGNPGHSLKVNLTFGYWKDWASDDKGGDLISLYARKNGISQGDAYLQLGGHPNAKPRIVEPSPQRVQNPESVEPNEIKEIPENQPISASAEAIPASMPDFGKHVAHWCYRDPSGQPLFYVSRWNASDGSKGFAPWSWNGEKWTKDGYKKPRPLYGLEILSQDATKPVMLVEGEKACDAARAIAGKIYTVMTWAGGASATKTADWSSIKGRRVVLWPDADEPGLEAMDKIASILGPQNKEVKIFDVSGKEKGWDAADALAEKMDWNAIRAWQKDKVKVWSPALVPVEKKPELLKKPTALSEHATEHANATREQIHLWLDLGLSQTKSGQPVQNADNVLRLLERLEGLKDHLWFDDFTKKFYTMNGVGERPWEDKDELNLMIRCQREFGLATIGDKSIHGACMVYGLNNTRNKLKDWLESLKWDGTDRIGSFFIDYMGAENTAYARAVSANFWVGLTARIYKPGLQVDNMVILEGTQGNFKTSSLRIIGGEWYGVPTEQVTSKDFLVGLQGKLIVEIAENDAFGKAEASAIKRIITTTVDSYRMPYGRHQQNFPRSCVFVGTTNEQTYLKDNTGARRFWPIVTTKINLERITVDRAQFFAEAYERFKGGATWWEMPEKETKEQQEKRRVQDAWEDLILRYLETEGHQYAGVTIAEIAKGALEIEVGRLDYMVQQRITRILTHLGIVHKVNWDTNSKNPKRCWIRPDE
jgi:predicted P-loop ATPase